MENVGIIFSSTVIAGIVSALFTLYNNNRQNTLTRITDERGKWRTKLRDITYDLELHCGDPVETKLDIAKLQALLNPYGKYDNEIDSAAFYYHDGHIWKIIESYDGIDIDKLKILQFRIYLALKFDWERSKEEIRTNITLILSIAFAIIGGIFTFMNITGSSTIKFAVESIAVCIYVVSLVLYPLFATRWQSYPVTIVITIVEIIMYGFTFRIMNLEATTGILALAFCIFSIIAMFISESNRVLIRCTFIKNSKNEYLYTEFGILPDTYKVYFGRKFLRKKCVRCEKRTPADAIFCHKCGWNQSNPSPRRSSN